MKNRLESAPPLRTPTGFVIHPGYLDADAQAALLDDIRAVVRTAPLVQPVTPGGRKMSVQMTAAGRLGWITDRKGYRYADRHLDGMAWPPVPESVLAVWTVLSGTDVSPDCCLINFYAPGARMGLHQDRDEGDFSFPVVSISLGDEALFRMGGTERSAPTSSVWLRSGDVVVMGGPARLAWHGIDRIRAGTSTLMPQGGRVNLTLRVVRPTIAG